MPLYSTKDIARFWSKVEKTDSCWLWKSTLNAYGYGVINIGGKLNMAHRMAHFIVNGDDAIPPGLVLDHLCKVKNCVNPSHTEVVTQTVNARRSDSPFSLNSRKTHCPQGHPLSGSNIKRTYLGDRSCRECDVQRKRDDWNKNKDDYNRKRREKRKLRNPRLETLLSVIS